MSAALFVRFVRPWLRIIGVCVLCLLAACQGKSSSTAFPQRFTATPHPPTSKVPYQIGLVIQNGSNPDRSTVEITDATNGSSLWTLSLGSNPDHGYVTAIAANNRYFLTSVTDRKLIATDKQGRILWSFVTGTDVGDGDAPFLIDKERVYTIQTVRSRDRLSVTTTLNALKEETGAILWQRNVDTILGWDATTVYVVLGSRISGYRLSDGTLLWETQLPARQKVADYALAGQWLITIGSYDTLSAIDVQTGKLIWQRDDLLQQGYIDLNLITVTPDMLVVKSPRTNGTGGKPAASFQVLRLTDGQTTANWQESTRDGDPGRTIQPIATNDDGTIGYQVDDTGQASARNLVTGSTVWRAPCTGRCRMLWYVGNQIVYTINDDATLYAFRSDTGALLWQADLGGTPLPRFVDTHLALTDDGLCLTYSSDSGDQTPITTDVYFLRASSGELFWHRQLLRSWVINDPVLLS